VSQGVVSHGRRPSSNHLSSHNRFIAADDRYEGTGADVQSHERLLDAHEASESEIRGDDIGGMAVQIGGRMSALAGPNDVLVSSTLPDLVIGSGLEFEERGAHELKGVPGEWRGARESVAPSSLSSVAN
jgi:hypothetical protein